MNKNLDKYVAPTSLALQIFFSFFIGAFFILRPNSSTNILAGLIISYFVVGLILGFINIILSLRNMKNFWQSLLRFGIDIAVVVFIIRQIESILSIFPLLFAIYSFMLSVTYLVTFIQYRKENFKFAFQKLLGGAVSLLFSLNFLSDLFGHFKISLILAGVYLIFTGLSLLSDLLNEIKPDDQKVLQKRKVRLALPLFLAALIPNKTLRTINTYISSDEDLKRTQKTRRSIKGLKPNVEVFVHVEEKGFGAMGHVDICIENDFISYGSYDESSQKLLGAIGDGVIFIHQEKNKYIKFCQETSQKTLFGFGLYLSREEIKNMRNKLEEVLKKSYSWDPQIPEEYAERLFKATNSKFYKFKSGPLKYYFVLGANCVKFVDTLLSASGSGTIISGIITPGTYYDFLNNEFLRKTGRVLTKKVYIDKASKR